MNVVVYACLIYFRVAPCTEIVFASSTISHILRSFYINAKCKMRILCKEIEIWIYHTNINVKIECVKWAIVKKCAQKGAKDVCFMRKSTLGSYDEQGWAEATKFPSKTAVLLLRGLSVASALCALFCAPIAPKSISLLNDFSISLLTATFVATKSQKIPKKYAGLCMYAHIYVFNGNRSPFISILSIYLQ